MLQGSFEYMSGPLPTTQSAMQELNPRVQQVMTDSLDKAELAEFTAWPF